MTQTWLALITGVSGFIGKHIALRYLQAGWWCAARYGAWTAPMKFAPCWPRI